MEKSIEKLEIDGKEINVAIKSIKRSKSIKMYVKSGIICINKPFYVSKKLAYRTLLENIDIIRKMYEKDNSTILKSALKNEEYMLYNGKKIKLKINFINEEKVVINMEESYLKIEVYNELTDEEKIDIVKKTLTKFFKKKLDDILNERLEYFSKIMKIEYSKYSIKKMSSRYGSCNPKTKKLNFNVNLIFMEEEVRDSIIVHELSHIVYPNHSNDFYNLVYKYSPNYDKCKKWIKENHKYLCLFD